MDSSGIRVGRYLLQVRDDTIEISVQDRRFVFLKSKLTRLVYFDP